MHSTARTVGVVGLIGLLACFVAVDFAACERALNCPDPGGRLAIHGCGSPGGGDGSGTPGFSASGRIAWISTT